MPRLIVSAGAQADLVRCRRFLSAKNQNAAQRASQAIRSAFANLVVHPEMGRKLDGTKGLRELVIGFGDTGYVALYRYDVASDIIVIAAFRHQREAGY